MGSVFAGLLWGNHTGFSSFTSSIIGVCTAFPFTSPKLATRTSTRRGSCWYNIHLSPQQILRLSALMLFFRAGTDDARFDRVDALQLFLDLQQALLRSRHHKVMSVRQAPIFLSLVVKQVSRTASHFIAPIFEVSLPVSFLIACCISCAVHVFLQRPNLSFIFPCSIVCW